MRNKLEERASISNWLLSLIPSTPVNVHLYCWISLVSGVILYLTPHDTPLPFFITDIITVTMMVVKWT
jgi:hypothetical protein